MSTGFVCRKSHEASCRIGAEEKGFQDVLGLGFSNVEWCNEKNSHIETDRKALCTGKNILFFASLFVVVVPVYIGTNPVLPGWSGSRYVATNSKRKNSRTVGNTFMHQEGR